MAAAPCIDSDQHLYEPRTMWADHIDPARHDDALSLVDDDRGYTWLTWRGQRLDVVDVHQPGNPASCGHHRQRLRRGEPSEYSYDDTLPPEYWDPVARVGWLDSVGFDEAVCFPNYGLLWERRLSGSLPALTANMAAWNRWCATIAAAGGGRLHPVGHLTLRDAEWAEGQVAALASAGVRLAMVAPSPVNGRPLSHADHDRLWSAFVDHGVTPVFHVADQPRVFDDCWYTEDEALVPAVESVFIWVPPALAVTDLILGGVFDRFPDMRVGIVELSSIWVPQYLLMLDGGFDVVVDPGTVEVVEVAVVVDDATGDAAAVRPARAKAPHWPTSRAARKSATATVACPRRRMRPAWHKAYIGDPGATSGHGISRSATTARSSSRAS